jgi:exopolysaccharide biosynthesis polyprenyl glycosylphosphotransferase
MQTVFRPRTLILFLGDLLFFGLALYLSLSLRALELVAQATFVTHLYPFSVLFVAWILVYFIAGLYESRSVILARRALSATLLVAQTINMVTAALFFFFVPAFGIAPKTLLVIYLVVSFLLVLLWRAFIFPRLGITRTEPAIAIGEGQEIDDLVRAMNRAERAPVRIAEVIHPASTELSRAVVSAMERHRASVVVADFDNPRVSEAFPHMYNLLSVGVRFIDALDVYEEIFGRIPLSRLNEAWFARNISTVADSGIYDVLKRGMDIVVALPAGLVSLVVYPFVVLAIKLEDRGSIFVPMPRVGEHGRQFNFFKFRSMTGNDGGNYGASGKSELRVTKVGAFIRATRIDELPQLWNVLKGDLSLIGPRPELPRLVSVYEQEIAYYNLRHLVKPGVSGWAQIYHHADPHASVHVEETRNKLSYDLYYLKHRSLLLDITIALKTVRRILMRGNA